MGKWVLHTNLARAHGCPPSRSGYCTRDRNAGSYHAIRRITLSTVSRYPRHHPIRGITQSAELPSPQDRAIRRSHYPQDRAIRGTMLYAVAGTSGRAPARQSKCDDGALPLFLLSCPEMPAPQGPAGDYSRTRSPASAAGIRPAADHGPARMISPRERVPLVESYSPTV